MSETDPYAAPDAGAPNVYYPPAEELKAAAVETEQEPVADPSEPETDTVVPVGTIAEVLAWVGEDHDRALRALAAEEVGQNRKSLIKTLAGS